MSVAFVIVFIVVIMTINIVYLIDDIFCLIFHINSLVTEMAYWANNVTDLNTNSGLWYEASTAK